ncbi:autorepressor SdpR family transcription factor [Desulfotomaculum copahuensis]|uniref:Transcriptional regulator n=1 Tax=Desulfotomaculum copahuensis TaxID=1838280 RepID=A0A1B7LKT0_9FIRM|nr:autorepressor SdpR family transcription factor [Desulfotomaculum copahuensis]OAT87072.1 transcriptional regulator [Desulfotomaculum copahuensis]
MGLSDLFRALGDETRREILRLLTRGDLTAGEIADRFNLTKPTISHHLAVLKQAGLVQDERRAQYVVYSLNTTVFQDLAGWLLELTCSGPGSGRARKNEPGGQ